MDNNTDTSKKIRSTYKEPKFYLDGRNNGKPEPIFLKFSFAPGKRISFYTGQRVETNNWNSEKQRVKKNIIGGTEVNDVLNSIEEEARKAVRDAKHSYSMLTAEMLRERLNIVIGKQAEKTNFFEIYDHFIETESKLKAWSRGTIKRFKSLRNQLTSFETYQKSKKKSYKIELAGIDEKFHQELIDFWQSDYNLRNSTMQKNIKLLRWFFNWCAAKNKISNDYKTVGVDLKTTKRKIIFLELEEIGKMYRLEIPTIKKYLERTKDIFIFQCLTGLRFSDLHNLKATDKKGDVIVVSTIKTGEEVEIDLNETTLEIWQKYNEHQAATGRAFPVPTNQVYNKFLKELAKMAELNETITLVHYKGAKRVEETFTKAELICTHTARRSFITNGLTVGIGSEVIRSWTGHQSEKAFKDYYEIVKAKKAADIQKMVI